MATKDGVGGTGVATGTLNIGGGSFTITPGGSLVMATNLAATGSAVATINLTGGTLTSNTDVIKGGGANATATINLSGGTLDLAGHNIGSATASIDHLNFQSGTLRNVGTINGTGGLTKTTAGALVLSGTNSYTGPTVINGGELRASTQGSLAATNSISVAAGSTFLVGAAGTTDAVNNAASVQLAGGIFRGNGGNEGTGAEVGSGANGSAQNATGLGALSLTANSTLDFGSSGTESLVFSSFTATSGLTLAVADWQNAHFDKLSLSPVSSGFSGDDRLIFNMQLSSAQLAQIDFGSGYTTTEIALGGGYYEVGALQAVPEPGSLSLLAASGVLGLARFRKRRSQA
jgi:autotransporter-associated beta strand protein